MQLVMKGLIRRIIKQFIKLGGCRKGCANLGIKKVKVVKISTLTLAFVGITALLPLKSILPNEYSVLFMSFYISKLRHF